MLFTATFPAGATITVAATAPADSDRLGEVLARLDANALPPVYQGWYAWVRQAQAGDDPLGPLEGEALRSALAVAEGLAAGDDPLATWGGPLLWAYPDPVTGTAQPFRLVIPPAAPAPWPLTIYLHGAGGTHRNLFPLPVAGLRLQPLGRSRTSGYHGLGAADVLAARAFVETHWPVDPDRVSLAGGSMGGAGTWHLGSLYPDRWAALAPLAGSALFAALENLDHVPLFALHGSDDRVIPATASTAAIRYVREQGGVAGIELPTGLGHQYRDDSNGLRRTAAALLAARRERPQSFRYVATSGAARGAWGVEVVQWGAQPRPARFAVATGPQNRLHVDTTNVGWLRLELDALGLDRSQPLRLYRDGVSITTLDAPPALLFLDGADPIAWSAAAPVQPRHPWAPDGALSLYTGEPLLIVRGTSGDDTMDEHLAATAKALSASDRPGWGRFGRGDRGEMLYGRQPVKADHDVTAADMARHHLILLGGPRENAVAARLAPQLPVNLLAGRVVLAREEESWALRDGMYALRHYNPEAPQRLLFWIVGGSRDSYRRGQPVLELHDWNPAPDFVLMRGDQLVTARWFDPEWAWQPRAARDERPLPLAKAHVVGYARAVAAELARTHGAEAALALWDAPGEQLRFSPGEARIADARALGHERWLLRGKVSRADARDLIAPEGLPVRDRTVWFTLITPTGAVLDLNHHENLHLVGEADHWEIAMRALQGKRFPQLRLARPSRPFDAIVAEALRAPDRD